MIRVDMSSRIPVRTRIWLFFLLPIFLVAGRSMAFAEAAESVPQYQVSQRWPLPGSGGSNFLIVSAKDHRLYLSRENQVTVLNTDDGSVQGAISGLTDVRGIAIDSEEKFGYIGGGIDGTLKVFSVPTLKVTSSVKIGGTPEAVVADPATHRVFVFDSHNDEAVVVDPVALKVIGTIKLPGRPASAIAGGDGLIYVNLGSTSQLAQINARTLTLQLKSLAPCVGPSEIALDSEHARLFSVCENKLLAISDSHSGELQTALPIGEGARTVAFDPSDGLAISANSDGTLTVVKETSGMDFQAVETVKTEPGARTLGFDSAHRQLYLISSKFGQRSGPTSEELQFRPTPIPNSSVVLVMKP